MHANDNAEITLSEWLVSTQERSPSPSPRFLARHLKRAEMSRLAGQWAGPIIILPNKTGRLQEKTAARSEKGGNFRANASLVWGLPDISANDNSPRMTAAVVKKRLIEAFAVDNRLPNPGPRFRSATDEVTDLTQLTDGQRRELFHTNSRVNKDHPDYIQVNDGYSVITRGVKRNLAADAAEREASVRPALKAVKASGAWSALCQAVERQAYKRNEESRMFETLDWLVKVEDQPRNEVARQVVLCWFRAGGPRGPRATLAFCQSKGLRPSELLRWLNVYCEALASQLTCPRHPSNSIYFRARADLFWGLDAISRQLGRTPKNTLKMIEAGKIQAGLIYGHYCASGMLLNSRKTHKRHVANDNPTPKVAAKAA
jgi:hypothetical protein